MSEINRIPEAEYTADLNQGLTEIARAIKDSGLPLAVIARGTRCHWETVYHAARCIPVRYDSYRRIMFYLNRVTGTDGQ